MKKQTVKVNLQTQIAVDHDLAFQLGNEFFEHVKLAGLPLMLDYNQMLSVLGGLNARVLGMAKEQLKPQEFEDFALALKSVPMGIYDSMKDAEKVKSTGGLVSYQGDKSG